MNIPDDIKKKLNELALKNSHDTESYYSLYTIMWMRIYNLISKTK